MCVPVCVCVCVPCQVCVYVCVVWSEDLLKQAEGGKERCVSSGMSLVGTEPWVEIG